MSTKFLLRASAMTLMDGQDSIDHVRIGDAGHAALVANIGRDGLEGHDGKPTGVSNDAGWLDVDDLQDDIVIENLRHAAATLAAGSGRAVVRFISIAINSCEQKPRPT
jgi:hypothetical protein